jgi:hypothetical protein
MPYNTVLEDKIEDVIHLCEGIEKKKMFGGICYLVIGNMAFGVWKDSLIVRMAPALAAEKQKDGQARAFDITGKPMKGWVMVAKGSWDKKDELAGWLDIGRSFALSLPKKYAKGELSRRYTTRPNDNLLHPMLRRKMALNLRSQAAQLTLDERNHVENPLLDQLTGLGWEVLDLDVKQHPGDSLREAHTGNLLT